MARPRKKRSVNFNTYTETEALMLQKISDCNEVLSHLDSCSAWAIIVKDLEEQRRLIDSNWHMTTDEKQLQEFRITKFAIMHLLEIRSKYEGDLKRAEVELNKYRNQETVIGKDYDTDTILER